MVRQAHHEIDFVFDSSLVLYLPLHKRDGSSFVSDDVYGHLATVNGALWRPDGRYFDGIDDKINLPDVSPLSPTSQITLEAWFNPARTNTGRVISRFPADYKGWSLYHGTGIGFQLYAGTSLGEAFSAANTIAQDNWYHAVGTYDGACMRVYINAGASGIPLARTGSIVYTALQPAIGLDNGAGASQPFKGIIGEARIYSRALTPMEIQHNYLATKWRYQ